MKHKILVVDDEEDLQMLVTQKFRIRIKNEELHFEFANNGLNALDKLAEHPDIDIILSDINMPKMDGLTLLDEIRLNNFLQKTVMISAYGDMSNIRVAMNRGAFDFIVKPIDFSDLEITLNKAITETLKIREAHENKSNLEKERREKEELILNQNKILEQKVKERTDQLLLEKKKSDDLLLNILPEEVAEELKTKGYADAKMYDEVTVMFTDFIDFTKVSETLSPAELVSEIHSCFELFDRIISKHNIEKIKTIGDSYMCVGGLPKANATHAIDVVNAALEIEEVIREHNQLRLTENKTPFEIRLGIHSGPVVAGIVGVKKFAYDIWGDTVNTASRMESASEARKINISARTYELVKDHFNCTYRGKINAKGKGEIDMYFVEGRR